MKGSKPIAQYRYNGGCWSVTDDVIRYQGVVKVEIVGNGQVRVHSGRIYVDVVSDGKHEVFAGNTDTLRFVVHPSEGFYLDRIEIEDNEQVVIVPEEEIKEESDGTFTFHSSVTWQGDDVNRLDSVTKENFRFVFTEKQHIQKDLGEVMICAGDSVRMNGRYVRSSGWHYDTVPGSLKAVDTVYSLYLQVNPAYRDTLHFSVERDSMPYIHGKDTIRNFGLTELHRYQTVHGCDSLIYAQLDTLYIHRERHFYDSMQACGEAVLAWRGKEITQTGHYTDTVFDPYKGGTDSVYHLRADIYPEYRDTLYFVTERDSMPYIHGKDTIHNFGLTELHRYQTAHGCDSLIYVHLDTLYIHRERHFYDSMQACGEAVFAWRGKEITQTGHYTDTVFDPYKGGTDSIYHLRADIYPEYRDTLYFVTERDSMPYIHGKDTIRNFGLTELHRYKTVHGCDSLIYVHLDTLHIHREYHSYDTLQECGEAVIYWRGKQINQAGDYTDTVSDPYRGGTDSVYHLRAAIHPTFHTAHTDSCYIEELPYGMDGRQVADFGHHTDRHVTASGCDSVHEYSLSRRWHHYKVQVRVRGNGAANLTDTTVREDGQVHLRFTAATCHVLDSLRIDGRPVAPNTSCLLENLRGDCLVEAVFRESTPTESVLRYEVCTDSLPVRYNGEAYGAGEHEIRFTDAAGCDSIVRLNVREKRNAARIAVTDTITPPCGADAIPVSYRVEAGSPQRLLFRYDAAAHAAGFRDTAVDIRGGGERKTDLPLPPDARPDRYSLQLWQADATGCYSQDETLTFEIPYPSGIIVQKWNDVLAVLSPEYNGGHEFSAYQWYADGEPIAGETGPYLYRKPYLPSTSRYSVLLERIADGLRLMSCPVKRQAYPRELALELRPNPAGQGSEVEVRVGGKPEAEGT
ncbi:MAG: hypothetical protein NC048_06005, partial [Bacteroides sp.]|nr:hypothetical protein [Bacteroides sp.]